MSETQDAFGHTVERNDIVQITDQGHQWFPALLIVEELKGWGVMGYHHVVTNDDKAAGQAYIRIKGAQFEKVGSAVIVNQE